MSELPMQFRWVRLALVNFLVAALIGVTLRYAFVEELVWLDFRNAMHAHSHGAMLGWLYLALFALFVTLFLPEIDQKRLVFYHRLFWATQVSVIGMFVSFWTGGYHAVSIAFSTAHILLSYVFLYHFWRDGRKHGTLKGFAGLFARTALIFMAVSTLALWGLGPLMASGLQGSAFYYASIQWFLHFQFNGWFVFGAIAAFLRLLKNNRVAAPVKLIRLCFRFLLISVILTYTLAVTWSTPLDILFYVNSTGVIVQLLAAVTFVIFVKQIVTQIRAAFTRRQRRLFSVSLYCFLGKMLVQAMVVIPSIAVTAYTIRNFVIGFIHLILLGAVTHMVLGAFSASAIARFWSPWSRAGLRFIFAGFVLSELVLVIQGIMFWMSAGFLPHYYILLFGVSAFIPVGIALLLFSTKPSPV